MEACGLTPVFWCKGLQHAMRNHEWDHVILCRSCPSAFSSSSSFSYILCFVIYTPKICVFRSSTRIHCYLILDTKRGCLLRRSFAWWCGGGVLILFIYFFNLLKSVVHYRKHLCLGAPHSALERPWWSAAEVLQLADQDRVQKSPRFTLP